MNMNARKLRTLTLAFGAAIGSMAAPLTASAEVTGNIGAVSKYVLRGVTNNAENDSTAIQGGLDYSHASGLYAGYWGSNLDYGNATTVTGFENDFYAGYKFDAGPLAFNLGAIYYLYTEVEDSDGLEAVLGVGMGPVTLGVKYLLDDVAWGNDGDMYVTVDYSQPLPNNFTLAASYGHYFYDDDDAGNPLLAAPTTVDDAFRHLNLTLSHPVAKDAATMSVTYILGGEDRSGVDQKDAVVLGLSTTF
jgi:uncharacterized protein (TIGR02001 family)